MYLHIDYMRGFGYILGFVNTYMIRQTASACYGNGNEVDYTDSCFFGNGHGSTYVIGNGDQSYSSSLYPGTGGFRSFKYIYEVGLKCI